MLTHRETDEQSHDPPARPGCPDGLDAQRVGAVVQGGLSVPAPASHARHAIPTAMARRGLRLTGPRQAVVEALVDHAAPMSVAEIADRLKGRRINLVSIYRSVNLLCELGLLRVVDTAKGKQRFELAEQFTGHHHHLVCEVCGSVEDLDGCLLEDAALNAMRQRVRRLRSFRLTGHDLKLVGVCKRCDSR
jgi:Fur family ferric uptake transcriptional regulator